MGNWIFGTVGDRQVDYSFRTEVKEKCSIYTEEAIAFAYCAVTISFLLKILAKNIYTTANQYAAIALTIYI